VAPDAQNTKRAGDLQLEDLKKVDKRVLEKAKMSEAEYQKFLKAYQEMRKRTASEPRGREDLAAPQRGGSLPSQGVRQVDGGAAERPGHLSRSGTALPPLEFREAQNEFTRKLSELTRSPEPKK
jgi:hypothetical protein